MNLLPEIAEVYGGKIYSDYVAIVCPYHDDHSPSMIVHKDLAVCMSCGKIVKPEELLTRGVYSRPSSSTRLKDPPWIPLDQYEAVALQAFTTLVYSGMDSYLVKRGVSRDSIIKYRLGIFKGWFTFPVLEEGSIVRMIMRVSPPMSEHYSARFTCSGTPIMYAPDRQLIEEKGHLVVVFGTVDAVSLCSNGIPAVTSTSGYQSFKPEWVESYRMPIHIIPDVGEEDKGRDLAKELGWRSHLIRLPEVEGLKDPNDYITSGKLELLKEMIYGTQ